MPVEKWASQSGPPQVWRKLKDGTTLDPGSSGSAQRFPGDPGALTGSVISGGVSPGAADGIDFLDSITSKHHAGVRLYGATSNSTFDWTGIDNAIALGRLPVASTKFTQQSPANIAAGALDSQLLIEVNKCIARAPRTLWLSYYHEPEDNFNSPALAADFRAASRYIVQYFRARAVSNVAWFFPSYQTDWSFVAGGISSHGGEAYLWDPDWKGTLSNGSLPNASDFYTGGSGATASVVDMLGFDQYSPSIGSTSYVSYVTMFANMKNKFTAWGRPPKPYVIPEIMYQDASPSRSTAQWVTHLDGALTSMLAEDVVMFLAFSIDNGNGHSFITEDPTGTRRAAYLTWFPDSRILSREQIAALV